MLSAPAEVQRAVELPATGQRIGYLPKIRMTDVDDFIERWTGSSGVVR